ncbi:hypothetical protein [Syntrophotalea carbinolica]|uniref:hypothetical protein n=1 Tax=Syntrophotalea carbinolica TaxID=19 RepID=UPI00130E7E73|nr:hypothetical protein [Syntrophotalea carbinolica]
MKNNIKICRMPLGPQQKGHLQQKLHATFSGNGKPALESEACENSSARFGDCILPGLLVHGLDNLSKSIALHRSRFHQLLCYSLNLAPVCGDQIIRFLQQRLDFAGGHKVGELADFAMIRSGGLSRMGLAKTFFCGMPSQQNKCRMPWILVSRKKLAKPLHFF